MPVIRPHHLPWFAWGIAASFYAYGFFLRVAPSVLVDELMLAFTLDAASIGTLSAAYFYAYAAAQIPIGLATDRIGPRRMIAAGAALAAVSSLVFAFANDPSVAWWARALTGTAVGVAYLSCLKMASLWFPPEQFGRFVGLTLFVGICGAVLAQTPLALLAAWLGWRWAIALVGCLGFVVAIAVMVLVPKKEPTSSAQGNTGKNSSQGSILAIFLSWRLWLTALYTGTMAIAPLTFAGLWSVPFLNQVHGLEKGTAGLVASAMLIAWALGGPIAGWLTDRLGRCQPVMVTSAILVSAGWLLMLLGGVGDLSLAVLAMVITGFAAGGMIVAFAQAQDLAPAGQTATVASVVNSAVLLFGAAGQFAFGWRMDQLWDGLINEGVRRYSPEAYAAGIELLLTVAAIAILASAFLKDRRQIQT